HPPGAPNGKGDVIIITDGEVKDSDGNTLLQHQCGVYRDLVYQLMDQQNPAQPIGDAFTIKETFTDYSGSGSAPTDVTVSIGAGHPVGDVQYFGRAAPNCPGADDHDTFKQHFTVTLNGHDYTLTTVVTISRGRFSGTYKCDVDITTP